MRQSLVIGLMVGAAATVLVGCGTIRVVRVSKGGGEIALLGLREKAMEKAQVEMANTCGGPGAYEILEQGEVPIGEVSKTHASQTERPAKTLSGKNVTRTTGTSTTETAQKTEWRLKYACKGAAPAEAAPAAPAAPAASAAPAAGALQGKVHTVVVSF
jgi:hypothetical protein